MSISKEIIGFLQEATDRDDISIYGLIENYLQNFEDTYNDEELLIEVRDSIVEKLEDAIKTLDK